MQVLNNLKQVNVETNHSEVCSPRSINLDSFGQYLKKVRKEAGYTMWELSKKICCEVNEIEHLERGHRMPRPEEIFHLARVLGKQLLDWFEATHVKDFP